MINPNQKIICVPGQQVNECTFIRYDFSRESGKRYGIFLCKCGKSFSVRVSKLFSGHTKSCGCFRRKMVADKNFRHGLSHTIEHGLWLNMKQRCTNHNFKFYKDWGGRGITVCEDWVNSFEKFYEDMGKQPCKGMGIDRIDNSLGYSKSNCRWASHKIQNNNKRNNLIIEFKGVKKSLSLWSDELGLNYEMARYYIHKKKIGIEEIFTITKKAS